MKFVHVLMEKNSRTVKIIKVFDDYRKAVAYKAELIGDEEFYDFDSTYQYWIETCEVE